MKGLFHLNLKWIKNFNLKILLIGHIIFNTFDYAFDFVLYPFVIFVYGPLYGGVFMGSLAVVICLFIAYVYDRMENDWLGIETIKELVENFFKEEEDVARKGWKKAGKKILYWVFHRNKVGQFVFLSLHFDPLITTIYMRRGYHLYNGFSRRDWKIFWGSAVVSNVYWTLLSFVGVSALEKVIRIF